MKLKDIKPKVRKGNSEMVRKSVRHEDPRKPKRAKQKRDWKKALKDF